jgi:integrase
MARRRTTTGTSRTAGQRHRQPVKLVREILGHATSSFTRDVYAVVAEELAEAAAVAIAAFIAHKARPEVAQ